MNASLTHTIQAFSRRGASLIAALVLLGSTRLLGDTSREYDVKAAFLYNFITFTDWPADDFTSPSSPYVIGIMGEDPFGPVIEQIVNGEQIKSRPLQVRRFKHLEDMQRVHILFLSSSESHHLPEVLRWLKGQPILTVSDIPGFAEAGGGIEFLSDTRIKLLINPSALREANLTVSSKLLRLAQLVPERRSP